MPTFVLTVDASGVITAMQRAGAAVEGFDRQLRRSEGSVRQFERGVTSFRRAVLGVQNILLGFGLSELVRELIHVGLSFDRVRFALVAAHSSVEAATADFEWLKRTAAGMGIEVDKAGMQYAKFAAAAKGTALQGQGVRDVFTAVSKASVAMGLDAATTERVFMALTQMLSKGKVQAEEARQQFGEHLPGGFRALAAAWEMSNNRIFDANRSLASFQVALKSGTVNAITMMQKLPAALDEMFGPAFQAAMTSPVQAVKVFQASWKVLLDELAHNGGFLREFTGMLLDMSKAMQSDQGRKQMQDLSEGLGNLMHVVRLAAGFIVQHIQAVASAFAALGAMMGVRGLMALIGWMKELGRTTTILGLLVRPWMALAGAIGIAAGALVLFNNRIVKINGYSANGLDWMIAFFDVLGEKIKKAGERLWDWATRLPGVGGPLKTFGNDLKNALAQIESFRAQGLDVGPGVIFNSFKENFRNLLQPVYDWLDNLWQAIKVSAGQTVDVVVDNFRNGINQILGLFGIQFSQLPQRIATWLGGSRNGFKSLVDAAKFAVELIIGAFFTMVQTIALTFKLVMDIAREVLIALNPVVEAFTRFKPSADVTSAWDAFGKLVNFVFEVIAIGVSEAVATLNLLGNVFGPILEGIMMGIDGIIAALGSFDQSMKQNQQSANDAGGAFGAFLDLVVGGVVDAIRVIGLMIEIVGVLVNVLVEAMKKSAELFSGFLQAYEGIRKGDLKEAAAGGQRLADAFTHPLSDRTKANVERLMKDVNNVFSNPTLHPVTDAAKAGQRTLDAFGNFRTGFQNSLQQFRQNMDAALRDPAHNRNAGQDAGKAYMDGFFNEVAGRATDLTQKKYIQKTRLEEEQRRLAEQQAAAAAAEEAGVDRRIVDVPASNSGGHHGKSPAQRAAEKLGDLMRQRDNNNSLAAQIGVTPQATAEMAKAVQKAQDVLNQSLNVSYSAAISGRAGALAKNLAMVAVEASLAEQKLEAYRRAEEAAAGNNEIIDGYRAQAAMAHNLAISSEDLADRLSAEEALRSSGLRLSYDQATALDAEGHAINQVAYNLVKSTEAREAEKRVAEGAVAVHKQLLIITQQTASEFDRITPAVIASTHAFDEYSAETSAQHAVMQALNKDVFDFAMLSNPMVASLYEQSKALAMAGGSAEAYAQKLQQVHDQFNKNTMSKSGYAQNQINDQADSLRDAVNGRVALAQGNYDRAVQDDTINAGLGLPGDGGAQIRKTLEELTRVKAAADKTLAEINYNAQVDLMANSNNFQDQLITSMREFGKEAEDIGGQLHDTFARAFDGMTNVLTEFVMTGKLSFGDLARSVIQDITRMIVKWLMWKAIEAIGNAILPGAGTFISSVVPHAKGGVMTDHGELPLRKYAKGGVAKSAQLAMFGEGSKPEAYVPLPDGRTIPVTISGDSVGEGRGLDYVQLTHAIASGVQVGVQSGNAGRGYVQSASEVRGNAGPGSIAISVAPVIHVEGGPGQGGVQTSTGGKQDAKAADQLAKKISAEIRYQVVDVVRQEMRPGGAFNPMGSNRSRF